jgi:hypothetical protein
VQTKGGDPLTSAAGEGTHPNNRPAMLLDLRLAAGHHTAGHCTKGAFRLAGLPDPAKAIEPWCWVAYVCAPDLHEAEALRAVREAGRRGQDAVFAAYVLGGLVAAEYAVLEVMTAPGGFL